MTSLQPTSTPKLLLQLLLCTIVGWSLIIALYAINGGSFSSRTGFAITMSVAPAMLAWALTWWNRLRPYAWVIYVVLFVVLLVLQMWLRTL